MTKQKSRIIERWKMERSMGIRSYFQPNWEGGSDLVIEFAKPSVLQGEKERLLRDLKEWEQSTYEWNFCKAPEPRHTFYKVELYNSKGKKTHSQMCSTPSHGSWGLERFDEYKARLG